VVALLPAEYGSTVNVVAPAGIATPGTGREETDVHAEHRPACRSGGPATPARPLL
jgi:hypothetical protein